MEQGYFDTKNREYVLTDMFPVRPMRNYLFNSSVVFSLDQFGFGISSALTGPSFRPLLWEERLVYIKDLDNGDFYVMNRNYDLLPFEKFVSHYGIGYSKIETLYHGLQSEYTILVPQTDFVELGNIKVKNVTNKVRHFSIFSLVRPHINVTWHSPYTKPAFDKEMNGLYYSHTGYNLNEKFVHSVFKSDAKIASFSLSERLFKGYYNSFAHPFCEKRATLDSEIISFEDKLLGVLQFDVTLQANEEKEINVAYALSDSKDKLYGLSKKYGNHENFAFELREQAKKQDQIESAYKVTSQDKYLDLQVNTWLKRQITLGETWGRVYGKGFRDVFQDVASFLSLDLKTARERILKTVNYYKINGNTIRQFDPIFDEPYRDGASWVPQTILTYLKESGDVSILDEVEGYYDSTEKDSVFAHMVLGLDFLLDGVGEHGLCLWGCGDWNDSMNACGIKGKGESVWISLAAIKATKEFEDICRRYKPDFDCSFYMTRRNRLIENVKKHGFDKDHFIYGYNDYGERVGSYENPQYGNIYLNTQTWAILAHVFDGKENEAIMDLVESKLKCDYGYKLVDASIKEGTDRIGRVSYFFPGCFENGSVYIHGNAFKIAADLMLKRADKAYETLKLIRYNNPKNPNSGMEPFAISNMFLGPEAGAIKGFAPQSWITGSAGWIYRDITESMMGIKADFDGLRIEPCLPKEFKDVKITRIYRGVTYEVHLLQDGNHLLKVDDHEIEGNLVRQFESGTLHTVEFHF